ncbi:MAG: hypothetical protein ACOYN6_06625 [Ignavibacteria bacterium]
MKYKFNTLIKFITLSILLNIGEIAKAQQIEYLDWGYVKICYDASSVLINNNVIAVKIHNNFQIPIETDYGEVFKTILNIDIYETQFIIKDKTFFLTKYSKEGAKTVINNKPETYPFSKSKFEFVYKLKQLLLEK